MTDVQFMVNEDLILSKRDTRLREAQLRQVERKALYEECRDADRAESLHAGVIRHRPRRY